MPSVDRVVKLDARIGASPSRVTHLVPKFFGFNGFGHFPVGAPNKRPVRIRFDRLQERIRDPHRIVGILARNLNIGFRIPVCIIGWKFDRGKALTRILQDPIDIGFGDHCFFSAANGNFKSVILSRISGICH